MRMECLLACVLEGVDTPVHAGVPLYAFVCTIGVRTQWRKLCDFPVVACFVFVIFKSK